MKTSVECLTFNSFAENTYLLIDHATKHCAIIDPGCQNEAEEQELAKKIEALGVTPTLCLNTHCHIDHVMGNWFVYSKFGLKPHFHALELRVLDAAEQVSAMFGIPYRKSPDAAAFLEPGNIISIGETRLNMLFTPGHSPGSIAFHCVEENFVIGGDVLFKESIGRTDLPGGHHDTLIQSIKNQLFVLDNEVVVYSGHGPITTIGHEKLNNPFVF
jgi:glyoxylase-like metal-dependent hydrolase (beta-lactamase superfamily II)